MTNREKLVETFPNGAYTSSRTWMNMEYEEPTTEPNGKFLDELKRKIDKIYEREGNSVDCLNALDELKAFIDKHNKIESEE